MESISLQKWLKKVLISFTEQGLYSFPNFFLNIFLARWFSSDGYGAFAFGFSILLLLSSFHTALILEPMIVLGPAKYQARLFAYFKSMLVFHTLFTASIALAGILVALVVRFFSLPLAEGLFGASISLPFILLFWLFRRACYMYASPQIAAKGSLLYAISLLSVFLLHRVGWISVISAFLVMGAGSILASILVWFDLERKEGKGIRAIPLKEIWPDHWQYGKWATGSGVVSWLSSTVTIPLLGILLGLSASGIFRALQNLILPLQQISAALDSLFVPWLSGQASTALAPQFARKSRILLAGYFAVGLAYLVALLVANGRLVSLLYGNKEYLAYSWLVVYFGMYALADILSHGLSTTLRAVQKPNSVFWAQLGSAIVSLVSNVYLIVRLGIAGASYAMLAAGVVMLIILLNQYRKQLRDFIIKRELQVDYSRISI
jgi:O-antigen/teichoic acid export membrane protein